MRCLFVFSSIIGPVVVGFYKLAFFVNCSDCGVAIQPFGWTLYRCSRAEFMIEPLCVRITLSTDNARLLM